MTIVRIVNQHNPPVSIHALALLETLVQSCGYAFQLQISTMETLKDLVQRFLERPPSFSGPVMTKMLGGIVKEFASIKMPSGQKNPYGGLSIADDAPNMLTFSTDSRNCPPQS